jgi:Domain of unknown function (DUF4352)
MKPPSWLVGALILVAVALFAGCQSQTTTSSDPANTSTPVPSAESAGTTTTASTAVPASLPSDTQPETQAVDSSSTTLNDDRGTPENPVPVGEEASVGPWKVRVQEVTQNADDIVYNHSEFNEPPQAGNRYVLVNLHATRTGEEAAAFRTDTYVEFIGSGGAVFDAAYADIPDAMSETGEVDTGDSVVGNLVFEVPSDQISGGVLRLSEAFSFEDVEVFFAVD